MNGSLNGCRPSTPTRGRVRPGAQAPFHPIPLPIRASIHHTTVYVRCQTVFNATWTGRGHFHIDIIMEETNNICAYRGQRGRCKRVISSSTRERASGSSSLGDGGRCGPWFMGGWCGRDGETVIVCNRSRDCTRSSHQILPQFCSPGLGSGIHNQVVLLQAHLSDSIMRKLEAIREPKVPQVCRQGCGQAPWTW